MSTKPQRDRPGSKPSPLQAKPEELNVGDTQQNPNPGTAEVPKSRSSDDTPKWKKLESKDVRFRSDQLTELEQLRRRVAAARDDKTERFTTNTLVRVAVDLLLSRADDLEGDTEDALRESLDIGANF